MPSGQGRGPGAWILLAAAFLGDSRVLVLHDEAGAWYFSGDLTDGLRGELEAALVEGADPETQRGRLGREGFSLVEILPLREGGPGALFVFASESHPLSNLEWEGLRQLAVQLGKVASEERRSASRGPSGASFVPGVAHELRNFMFGISASLDAFEARIGCENGTEKYRANIRKSLDRLTVFVEELREYGDPRRRPWTEVALEPLLREAVEHHRAATSAQQIDLRLRVEGSLPHLRGDEAGLLLAFLSLIELALQPGHAGDHIELQASPDPGEGCIRGFLDVPWDLGNIDLARLFEPFYFRPAGLGRLALPVARRILETHGGNLVAALRPEGGLRISFTLPVI